MNNTTIIKEKLLSNTYKIVEKGGRSRIWDYFGLIEDENGIEMTNYVACKICNNIYTYNKNSLSNLNKHKCYTILKREHEVAELIEPSQDVKKACTEVLTEWILGDIRPYSLVNDNGLKALAKLMLTVGNESGANLNVESLIPPSTTILSNVESSFNIYFAKLKTEITGIRKNGYALTCDLWTENSTKISYLALTAHFVYNTECKSKLLGIKSMKGAANTSDNIKQKLESLLNDFDCSWNDQIVVVTDGTSEIKGALREHEHIGCINHLLYNAVEKCIKMCPHINELVTTASKLVKFVKKSGLNCDVNTSFSPTWWNTVYFTIVTIKSNLDDIKKLLHKKNVTGKYEMIKEHYLDQLIIILRPFMDTVKELEASSSITIHLVHPHIQNLKTICSITSKDEPSFISNFKRKLFDTLISLVDSNMTIYHKLAIFLFPPANQLTQFTLEEQTEIITKCKSLLHSYSNDIHIENKPPIEKGISKMYSLFEKYVQPTEGATSSHSIIENEVVKYKSSNVPLHNDFDVLKWWNDRKTEYPLLYKLSCRIFSIPASSSFSERIFSTARALITDKRSECAAHAKSFNQILFVNVNAEN